MIRRVVFVVAVGSLLLVGCGGNPERADTLSNPDGATQAAPDKAATAPGDDDELNAAEVKAALLALDDMPTGWTTSKPLPGGDQEQTITPAECESTMTAMTEAAGDVKPKASATAAFSAGDQGPTLEEEIHSWDKDPSGILAMTKDAFEKCPSFSSTADGATTTFEITGLSFPNVGDRTFAFRMKASLDASEMTFDLVYITLGKTEVSLMAGGLQPLDGDKLEATARKAVERVNEARK